MAKIQAITAKEILDSQGNPTIETSVVLNDDTVAHSSVPSGILHGTYESVFLRDNEPSRFGGLGVLKAVETVNTTIAPHLVGLDVQEQQKIDKIMIELDGTQNKMKLGGNSTISVSQAVAKAAARSSLLPLSLYIRQFLSFKEETHKIPTPMFNLIEGGKHELNGLNFQEFLVVPASSFSYDKALEMGVWLFKKLETFLKENNQPTMNADDGGFSPAYATNGEAFKALKGIIESSPYAFSRDIFLGVDIAANSFLLNKKYAIKDRNGQLNQDDLIEVYQSFFNDYSLMYIEDPFAEDDWDGWKKMYKAFSSRTLLSSDDLTSTNPYRLQSALSNDVINSIVIKPDQIGTLTEALAVVEIAKFKQLKIVVSSRSGETDDDFIADFAVAVDADYVKFGAPSRERNTKYNRLSEIKRELEKISTT